MDTDDYTRDTGTASQLGGYPLLARVTGPVKPNSKQPVAAMLNAPHNAARQPQQIQHSSHIASIGPIKISKFKPDALLEVKAQA